ncbi:MAG: Phosphoserine phosphatase [Myxococcaceae bacterium]|nr:Phosphoserine phosphatase [Myxococcaceae bacterium]
MEQRAAAFFDLDRTLMRENSGQLYALNEYRQGRLSLKQLVQSSYWLLLHHLSLLDVERAYEKAASHWKGCRGSDVRELAAEWFKRDVAARLTPGGQRALSFHRAQGHPTVLLTNTSGYIAEAAADCWQLDYWLANEIPVDASGRITGRMDAPLCFGAGKVVKAEAWARAHDVSLAASYFYSDSLSDLPMLRRVGHPHVVHPDPRLRLEARRRGWPVHDWSRA